MTHYPFAISNYSSLRIVLAQLNFLVGDIAGNAQKIIQATIAARDHQQADLIVFPELAITGYPPEDLLYRQDFYQRIDAALKQIAEQAHGIDIILGYPAKSHQYRYNRAAFISHQTIIACYDKQKLPNDHVFDEMRYFKAGENKACVVELKQSGIKIGMLICEDIWHAEPAMQAASAGAELLVCINASPFSKHKSADRQDVLTTRIQETQLPILYVNCVGGQDELVFDGGSMALNRHGTVMQAARFFEEECLVVDVQKDREKKWAPVLSMTHERTSNPLFSEEANIYQALVLGLRDYIEKNHFQSATLGLSGGIDSALTLAIAVDAIGKDRVKVVMMPSRYNAAESLQDAKCQAETMGVHYDILSIEPVFKAFLETLTTHYTSATLMNITQENLQARCRGTLLMAISNNEHSIVLSTANKSEMSVGYSTLYGDMVGGICVLKDVFKTMVYRLARYRNYLSPVIPKNVLLKAPSAELAPNQKDQDSLPDYAILDDILVRYIERDESLAMIIAAGFDESVVKKVLHMVDRNEYKRRQSAPGIRITERAFGKDRRYPITSGFKPSVTESLE